jgi:hypothetical protein
MRCRMNCLAMILTGLLACKGGDQPSKIDPFTNKRPAALSSVEIARSEQACEAYVKAVCACADEVKMQNGSADTVAADLAEQCKLAEALPEALKTSLGILTSADLTKQDVVEAQDAAKKIAAECITQTARLASRGCGRGQPAPTVQAGSAVK